MGVESRLEQEYVSADNKDTADTLLDITVDTTSVMSTKNPAALKQESAMMTLVQVKQQFRFLL